jgi:adenylosuccinate synthase
MDLLDKEVHGLEEQGIQVLGNLYLSDKAHIVFNEYLEQEKNESRIGTTKNGIGIAYTKKMERTGTRFEEVNYRFVADTVKLIWEYIWEGRNILCEGAQGFQLDIDQGDYPYVTSSNCTSGAACTGLGIPPTLVTKVVGVTKGYVTKVGNGPFPTLMEPGIEEHIRKVGNEVGSTTGRSRKCGWLNLDQLKRATMVNGCSEIALTKVDVLAGLPEIKVLWQGQYVCFDGWESLDGVSTYEALPTNLKKYVTWIEATLDTKIKYLSIGKETERTVVL